jgi:hypothetical protein
LRQLASNVCENLEQGALEHVLVTAVRACASIEPVRGDVCNDQTQKYSPDFAYECNDEKLGASLVNVRRAFRWPRRLGPDAGYSQRAGVAFTTSRSFPEAHRRDDGVGSFDACKTDQRGRLMRLVEVNAQRCEGLVLSFDVLDSYGRLLASRHC